MYSLRERSGGKSCAPNQVGNILASDDSSMRFMASSILNSASNSRPYPLLVSITVVPVEIILLSRFSPILHISSRVIFLVLLTVFPIPPPISAISRYEYPCSLKATSLERSPPHSRCVWQSTKPGMTAFPFPSRTDGLVLIPGVALLGGSKTPTLAWSGCHHGANSDISDSESEILSITESRIRMAWPDGNVFDSLSIISAPVRGLVVSPEVKWATSPVLTISRPMGPHIHDA